MEYTNDKYSIKNLLFSKAIPNYVISEPVNGHKVYSCIDCGDRYMFESSYEYHIMRKSLEITYMCRHCNQVKVFHNRCNLLSHIRSHAFKTATINVSDLKIEPLPLKYLKVNLPSSSNNSKQVNQILNVSGQKLSSEDSLTHVNKNKHIANKCICFECKEDITATGTLYRARAKHFMQYTNKVFSCPVCLFALPTICALKTHLRLHLRCPPHYCPECGIHLSNKSIHYPYSHDCEGFKMMRATTRCKCPVPQCTMFHPTQYKQHMKYKHCKEVYKCPLCLVACFNEATIEKHLETHKSNIKYLLFYQCEICPGRLVFQNQFNNHIKTHNSRFVYPCWTCGTIFTDVNALIKHFTSVHDTSIDLNNINFSSKKYVNGSQTSSEQQQKHYKVVKRCDKCKRSFTYRCKYDQINDLPNECPYKCTSDLNVQSTCKEIEIQNQITCHICKHKISSQWEEIKNHYAKCHKSYRCLDAKVVLTKIDIKKYINRNKKNKQPKKKALKKKRPYEQNEKPLITNIKNMSEACNNNDSNFICKKCGHSCENKQLLEQHIVSHRDPCMAYQCMECGECFVVKPSFSTHLFIIHGISNVEDYINEKQCYNEDALLKHKPNNTITNEPLYENQCNICREQFDNSGDLEKHFRVHGMAFLMKNTTKTNSSP